jgi:hypothetical protein
MDETRNTSDVTVKIVDAEAKKRQFERAGFTFLRELSPAESPAGLGMDETVLRFRHPRT